MAVIKQKLAEGSNYKAIFKSSEDLRGKTIQAVAFDKTKRNGNGSPTVLATADGKAPNEETELLFSVYNLDPDVHLVEVWADRNNPNLREMLYPNIGDEFYIEIVKTSGA